MLVYLYFYKVLSILLNESGTISRGGIEKECRVVLFIIAWFVAHSYQGLYFHFDDTVSLADVQWSLLLPKVLLVLRGVVPADETASNLSQLRGSEEVARSRKENCVMSLFDGHFHLPCPILAVKELDLAR